MRVLTEGVHSGAASGIVPSSFRILRSLLSRIEDEATGRMKLPELFAEIPQDRQNQAKEAAAHSGRRGLVRPCPSPARHMPDGASGQLPRLILEKTWRPQLAVTGMDGYPLPENGGNVLLALFHRQTLLAPAAHRWMRERRAPR